MPAAMLRRRVRGEPRAAVPCATPPTAPLPFPEQLFHTAPRGGVDHHHELCTAALDGCDLQRLTVLDEPVAKVLGIR